MKKKRKYTKRSDYFKRDVAAIKKAMRDPDPGSGFLPFTVETGIPVKVTRGFECHVKYPDLYKAMEALSVGDSISYKTKELKQAVNGCRTALEKLGSHRFVTSKVDPEMSRTWRIDLTGNGKPNRLNGQHTYKRAKVKA